MRRMRRVIRDVIRPSDGGNDEDFVCSACNAVIPVGGKYVAAAWEPDESTAAEVWKEIKVLTGGKFCSESCLKRFVEKNIYDLA